MLKKTYIVLFCFVLLLINCKEKYQKYSETRLAMGTTLTLTFFCSNEEQAKKIITEIFNLADNLEPKLSSRKENTIVSALNRQKNMLITDTVVIETLQDAIFYAKLTDGAFDPALFNLIKLWAIEEKMQLTNPKPPSKAEIEQTLKNTGYKNIGINNNAVQLLNDVGLDLGAIAKGKILDELSQYMDEHNITDYFINGGGDIILNGQYGGVRPWIIAIANPLDKSQYAGVIESSGKKAIVTSGNYERFFKVGDKLYHHILDPQTGYPADNGIDSVTVIADNATRADALATACYVMGKEKGIFFMQEIAKNYIIYLTVDNKKIMPVYSNNIQAQIKNDLWNFTLLNK
jgi:thiamine biosynthesis lipoprotein